MYNRIYDFCKVRNEGNVFVNRYDKPTPRVEFLINLLESEGIEYELDKFFTSKITGYNIILKGSSSRMVVAHHDVNNAGIDNANDNSASVVNAIMVKKIMPEINVVLLDGEEFGGFGAQRVCDQIKEGKFGNIEWVLNLELTGKGGKYFFIGDYPGKLTDHIKSIFNCPIFSTPFNDSVIFVKNGIDSVVINPLPTTQRETRIKWDDDLYLEFELLFNCHSPKDTVDKIDVGDMREFVEEIVIPILKK
jgi:hypothetical protein